jgi:A/G-specific adenine glycosylase
MNQPVPLSGPLLAWYDRHRRTLPWRALPGEARDPYRIWLSEIMLQQTVVAAVIPYFERFIAKWPTIADLASAPLDDVLREWAGLGYYARARNLHRCAQVIVNDHGGRFPQNLDGLLALPGIGAYTAGAIAAIAFDLPYAAVDGNVERVLSRLARLETPLPAVKPEIRRLAEQLVPPARAGDFAQALMDLGATICTPTSPKCLLCPLNTTCLAYQEGMPAAYPRRLKKADKPTRYGHIFWIRDKGGNVLLRRRPEQGLLGGMMEFPSSPWLPTPHDFKPLFPADWQQLPGIVRHTFTHFHLELSIHTVIIASPGDQIGIWLPPSRFAEIALPTVMKKVATHAIRQI